MMKLDLNNSTDGRKVFRAPQGYFDNLSSRVMQSVAEADDSVAKPKPAKLPFWKTDFYAKVKPYIYMAAMFGGLYFGVWVYKYQQRLINEKATASLNTQSMGNSAEEVEDYVNDACDYMMTDSHDIVACLTTDSE